MLAPHFDVPFRLSGGPGQYTPYKSMILDDNAEAYWRLETATPNADERSRRTLTSTGGVVQGGGLILDGGTSRYFAGAQYADASVLGSRYQYNGFSMEAWAKMDTISANYEMIFSCGGVTTFIGLVATSGVMYPIMSMQFGTVGQIVVGGFGTPVSLNTTFHLASTWDPAAKLFTLWLNGKDVVSTTVTAPYVDTGTFWRIGDYIGPSYPFRGWIDEVAVYTYPLSAKQIALHYQAGSQGFYRSSAAVAEQDTFEDIANCVEAIIRTPLGFRDDNLTFGMPGFELMTQPVMSQIITDIVSSQEPRAEIFMEENRNEFDQFIARVIVQVRQNPETGSRYGLHQDPT